MFIRQTRISNNRSFPHQGNSYTGILYRIQPGFALCDPIAFRKILYIFSEIKKKNWKTKIVWFNSFTIILGILTKHRFDIRESQHHFSSDFPSSIELYYDVHISPLISRSSDTSLSMLLDNPPHLPNDVLQQLLADAQSSNQLLHTENSNMSERT